MEIQTQWVQYVRAVSTSKTSPACLCGPPQKFPQYGIFADCWSPTSEKGTKEHLELIFEKRVYPRSINIYETYNPGALVKISVKHDSKWVVLYDGVPTQDIKQSRIFSPQLTKIDFKVNEIRLDFDTSHSKSWIGIDAVQLVGSQSTLSMDQNTDFVQKSQKVISSKWLTKINVLEESDVTILCGEQMEPFYAYKFLLEIQSEYFQGLFRSGMRENSRSCVILKHVKPDLFKICLHFLYSGTIPDREYKLEEFIDLLKLGDYFNLTELQELVLIQMNEKSFEFLISDEFLDISAFLLSFLIKSKNFLISDEELILQKVIQWGKHNAGDDSEYFKAILEETLKHVRYGLFESKFSQYENMGIFSPRQLIEIYKLFIRGPAQAPRKLNDSVFTYTSDFDEKGMIWYIGLNQKNTRGSWINPHYSEKVLVYPTGQACVNGNIQDFVGTWPSNMWLSANGPCAYNINLKSWSARVNKYTMRHFDQNCCYPRKWNFEGSNDGSNWDILREHEDLHNGLFRSKGESKSFDVDCKVYYQYFRIVNLLENSSNWNFGVSGFEMYGYLKKNSKSSQHTAKEIPKRKILKVKK